MRKKNIHLYFIFIYFWFFNFCSLSDENVEELLRMADRFNVPLVTEQCERFLLGSKPQSQLKQITKFRLAEQFGLLSLKVCLYFRDWHVDGWGFFFYRKYKKLIVFKSVLVNNVRTFCLRSESAKCVVCHTIIDASRNKQSWPKQTKKNE